MLGRLLCWLVGHRFEIWEPEVGGLYLVCTRCAKDASAVYTGGDRGWLEAHAELRGLHIEKADTYGSDRDALANYVETSNAAGQPLEFTCWLRIHEKTVRALNMIAAGRADEIREGMDVSALALGAEALRRRRC